MSDCNVCDEWKWSYQRLERAYENIVSELRDEKKRSRELESRVNELRPYKEASNRAYDRWVADPERDRT